MEQRMNVFACIPFPFVQNYLRMGVIRGFFAALRSQTVPAPAQPLPVLPPSSVVSAPPAAAVDAAEGNDAEAVSRKRPRKYTAYDAKTQFPGDKTWTKWTKEFLWLCKWLDSGKIWIMYCATCQDHQLNPRVRGGCGANSLCEGTRRLLVWQRWVQVGPRKIGTVIRPPTAISCERRLHTQRAPKFFLSRALHVGRRPPSFPDIRESSVSRP